MLLEFEFDIFYEQSQDQCTIIDTDGLKKQVVAVKLITLEYYFNFKHQRHVSLVLVSMPSLMNCCLCL
jgi:hypothetical protein